MVCIYIYKYIYIYDIFFQYDGEPDGTQAENINGVWACMGFIVGKYRVQGLQGG